MKKQWECRDCNGGETIQPCTAWHEGDDNHPTECPYGNGESCEWELKEKEDAP